MYHSIPMLYQLFSRASIQTAIWFCGRYLISRRPVSKADLRVHRRARATKTESACPGSSAGRGPRAAAWFGEYIDAQGDTTMRSMILEGGIKGWVAAGQEYIDCMDGFDEEAWSKEKLDQ
jgi:hypothetical protein